MMCALCFDEVICTYDPPCAEQPVLLKYQPIGMYHCPGCGMMVVAGMLHPRVCMKCLRKLSKTEVKP